MGDVFRGHERAIRRLLKALDDSAATFRRQEPLIEQRGGRPPAPPKLIAVHGVVMGLGRFLAAVDTGDGREERWLPVEALFKALDDLCTRRETEDWIKDRRTEAGKRSANLWHGRALVAAHLQHLMNLGVSRPDAQQAIHRVVKGRGLYRVVEGRGLSAGTDKTAYTWLCSCRGGERKKNKAAPEIQILFQSALDNLATTTPPERDKASLIDSYSQQLADELDYWGFVEDTPPIVSSTIRHYE